MKTVIILTIIVTLKMATAFGQCTNQVLNLTGTTTINGINVSVTSSGIIDVNTVYCSDTYPYFIGYEYSSNTSGNGSYTFNFSPAITAATLNFSGLTDYIGYAEEVKLFVNGVHYQIPVVGNVNGCDALATLNTLGNIVACSGCNASGWNGTNINGPIYSLTVTDEVISGTPFGSIFSLFICNGVSTNVEQNEIKNNYQLFPNPFSLSTTLQTNKIFENATLTVYNLYGQTLKQIKNISGQTVTFSRDNLPNGLYLVRLTEENKTIVADKLIITD